eukprot:m.206862 g.206862  ORF g.206862 m.206862 type:complete len:69 (+) comp39683_c0_seq3:172-378(+)
MNNDDALSRSFASLDAIAASYGNAESGPLNHATPSLEQRSTPFHAYAAVASLHTCLSKLVLYCTNVKV